MQSLNIDPEILGGLGGNAISRKDARLERRAILEGWDLPPEKLRTALEHQLTISTDEGANPREKTQAFNAIVSAMKLRLAAAKEPAEQPQQPAPSVAIQINNGGTLGTADSGGGRVTAIVERLRIGGSSPADS